MHYLTEQPTLTRPRPAQPVRSSAARAPAAQETPARDTASGAACTDPFMDALSRGLWLQIQPATPGRS